MEQTIIYKSGRKAVFVIIAGLLLAGVACLFFFYLNDAVFGWIFVLAAALELILGISSYLNRKPQVVLTDRGITDLTTMREEIEWRAIMHVDDFWFRGQDFVRLLVPTGYKAELMPPGWFWRLDRIYATEGVRAIYIRVSGLDVGPAAIVKLIKSRLTDENTNR